MNNQTVLVVDDEPDIRSVVSEILEDEGYRVDSAGDGSEARDKFNSLTPDLVLLDIWMPDTDGITLNNESSPHLKQLDTSSICKFGSRC